jgi:hypothetical protein
MNKRILKVLGVFVLTLAASQIYALSAPLVVKANIPFAFTIQSKNLPAGRYTIERVSSANRDLLMIRGDDSRFHKIFLSEDAETLVAPKETKLVFDKIGSHYFLREVWTIGETGGVEVPEAKAEKEVKSAGLLPTQVSVLARG